MQDKGDELAELRALNRAQREQIDLLARETESLLQKVQHVEIISQEIRNLVGSDEVFSLRDSFQDKEDQDRGDSEEFPAETGEPSLRLLSSRGDNLVIDRMALNIGSIQDVLPGKIDELLELKGALEDYQRQMAHTPSIWPTQGRVSSPFGSRINPLSRRREFHTGIDIANKTGTPIYATANGRVVVSEYRRGWGNIIIIDHGYGYRTVYAHLSQFSVHVGSKVEKGQLIGRMGSTGFSTGSHLHYEVHVNGVPVNPREYLP